MAKRPTSLNERPEDFPQTTPRDLHATSDIRLVMIELAKLATKVDRLIGDVADQTEKVDALRQQSTYIKGGLAVAAIAFALFGWFISQLVDGRLKAVIDAVSTFQK